MSDQSNQIAPYPLERRDGTEVSYSFTTDHGIEYVVRYVYSNDYYFDDSIDIGDTEILEFQFAPVQKGIELINDPRIMETLANSMKKVLEAKKNAILYICDSSDGKQAARSKLFNRWYKNYTWKMIIKHDGKLDDPDSPEAEFVSLIVNTQNPYSETIIEAFNSVMVSPK